MYFSFPSHIEILLGLLLIALVPLEAQDSIAWALQGKTNHLSDIQEVAIMENGDAVFCGGHDSLLRFGKHSFRGPHDKSHTGATKTSVFVGRISEQKEIRWIKQIASADEGLYVSDLEIDVFGNIYIIAAAGGIVRFSAGHSQNLGATGMLIAKLSPKGEIIWQRTYSGLGAKVHSYHILPRKDGKCYVLGNHGGGNFGSSKLPAGGDGQYSQYIGLVDEWGEPLWAESIGGPGGRITATDITFSPEGDVLICGNYRNIQSANIVDESLSSTRDKAHLETRITAGSPGTSLTAVSSKRVAVQAFIGKYHRDNGKAQEVHVYGGSKMSNATSLACDEDGNIYAGLSLYGEDLKIGAKVVPAYSGTSTMAIVKLDKNWNCLWHKSFDSPGADYVDDLSLDGQKLYAAALVAGSKLHTDDARYAATGMWSGALIRLNLKTGFAENAEHWEVGRALCIAMRDGKGFAGGWFHNSINLAGETFTVGKQGQFNAILVRLGSPESQDSSLIPAADSLEAKLVETQGQIEVFREDITLSIWDDQEVDKDIISLKYNEQWLIKNYTLSATPKTIRLKVKPGLGNHLEMLAISEGRIPPATTAIIISDGIRNHKMTLRSNPKTNGRIEIIWKPK